MSIYRDIDTNPTSIINNFLSAKQARLKTEDSKKSKVPPLITIESIDEQIKYCCNNGYCEAIFEGYSISISMELYLRSRGYKVSIKDKYQITISW